MGWLGVVSCEHASRDLPPEIASLGVGEDVMCSHVAWDPGAKEVATALAERFELPLLLGRWTRLVADLNRSPDNAESVPAHAFGVDVPANAGLSEAGRTSRRALYHTPYWDEVTRAVENRLARGSVLHVSVHSFTPIYRGVTRAVDLGLLFDPDRPRELAHAGALKAALAAAAPELEVRFNEPYDGRADGLTTRLRQRYPADRYVSIELEINQRHLDRIAEMAGIVAAAYATLGAFSGRPSTPP